MKPKYFILIFYIFCVSSCRQILDEHDKNVAQQNYTSPYQGTWIGSYSGNESGSLVINVAKNGYISGTKTFGNNTDSFLGAVLEGGSLLQVTSLTTGFTLYGNFEQKGGTWKQGTISGNWSVTKK